MYRHSRVDDGLWHRVRATRTDQAASLLVDTGPLVTGRAAGPLTQLNTGTVLYLGTSFTLAPFQSHCCCAGGVPDGVKEAAALPGLQGCLGEVSLASWSNIHIVRESELGRNIGVCKA